MDPRLEAAISSCRMLKPDVQLLSVARHRLMQAMHLLLVAAADLSIGPGRVLQGPA